jgi:FKBP-type peptidyl-prolyl cis-trans isomerase (trigger factor)
MKSTIKQLTNIDTSKAITIDRLHANQRLIQMHTKRLQEVFKNDTPEQINMKLQNVVARENVFNAIMTEVARNFEVTFDEEEVKGTIEKLKPQLPDQQPNVLLEMAKKIIIKGLIFDILAKE